jgi:hypothetical protein
MDRRSFLDWSGSSTRRTPTPATSTSNGDVVIRRETRTQKHNNRRASFRMGSRNSGGTVPSWLIDRWCSTPFGCWVT